MCFTYEINLKKVDAQIGQSRSFTDVWIFLTTGGESTTLKVPYEDSIRPTKRQFINTMSVLRNFLFQCLPHEWPSLQPDRRFSCTDPPVLGLARDGYPLGYLTGRGIPSSFLLLKDNDRAVHFFSTRASWSKRSAVALRTVSTRSFAFMKVGQLIPIAWSDLDFANAQLLAY